MANEERSEATIKRFGDRVIAERLGSVSDAEGAAQFDHDFGQSQSSSARFAAANELVVYYLKRRGRTDELPLQRSVENIQRPHG